MTDLVVAGRLRRQGIGSALVLAAQDWVANHSKSRRLVFAMQPKNFPAINLSQKLGFDFCGYNDHYYPNQDIAIFFEKWFG
jgi:ribosomal protein S18 acetylase RimI-like enzyme